MAQTPSKSTGFVMRLLINSRKLVNADDKQDAQFATGTLRGVDCFPRWPRIIVGNTKAQYHRAGLDEFSVSARTITASLANPSMPRVFLLIDYSAKLQQAWITAFSRPFDENPSLEIESAAVNGKVLQNEVPVQLKHGDCIYLTKTKVSFLFLFPVNNAGEVVLSTEEVSETTDVLNTWPDALKPYDFRRSKSSSSSVAIPARRRSNLHYSDEEDEASPKSGSNNSDDVSEHVPLPEIAAGSSSFTSEVQPPSPKRAKTRDFVVEENDGETDDDHKSLRKFRESVSAIWTPTHIENQRQLCSEAMSRFSADQNTDAVLVLLSLVSGLRCGADNLTVAQLWQSIKHCFLSSLAQLSNAIFFVQGAFRYQKGDHPRFSNFLATTTVSDWNAHNCAAAHDLYIYLGLLAEAVWDPSAKQRNTRTLNALIQKWNSDAMQDESEKYLLQFYAMSIFILSHGSHVLPVKNLTDADAEHLRKCLLIIVRIIRKNIEWTLRSPPTHAMWKLFQTAELLHQFADSDNCFPIQQKSSVQEMADAAHTMITSVLNPVQLAFHEAWLQLSWWTVSSERRPLDLQSGIPLVFLRGLIPAVDDAEFHDPAKDNVIRYEIEDHSSKPTLDIEFLQCSSPGFQVSCPISPQQLPRGDTTTNLIGFPADMLLSELKLTVLRDHSNSIAAGFVLAAREADQKYHLATKPMSPASREMLEIERKSANNKKKKSVKSVSATGSSRKRKIAQ